MALKLAIESLGPRRGGQRIALRERRFRRYRRGTLLEVVVAWSGPPFEGEGPPRSRELRDAGIVRIDLRLACERRGLAIEYFEGWHSDMAWHVFGFGLDGHRPSFGEGPYTRALEMALDYLAKIQEAKVNRASKRAPAVLRRRTAA